MLSTIIKKETQPRTHTRKHRTQYRPQKTCIYTEGVLYTSFVTFISYFSTHSDITLTLRSTPEILNNEIEYFVGILSQSLPHICISKRSEYNVLYKVSIWVYYVYTYMGCLSIYLRDRYMGSPPYFTCCCYHFFFSRTFKAHVSSYKWFTEGFYIL